MRCRSTVAAAVLPLLLVACSDADPPAPAEPAPAPPVAAPAASPPAPPDADARVATALAACGNEPVPEHEHCLAGLLGSGLDTLRDPSAVAHVAGAQEWLLDRSRTGGPRARGDALILLSAFGADAIAPLTDALDDEDDIVAAAAAAGLAHIRDPRVVDTLLARLVRTEEVEWDESFDEDGEQEPLLPDTLTPALVRALQAQGAMVVRPILESGLAPYHVSDVLLQIPHAELVPSLAGLLTAPDDFDVIEIARLLAETRDPAAVPALLDAIAAAPADLQSFLRPELLRFGEAAVDACAASVRAEAAAVRAACVRLLGNAAPGRHAALLRAALADSDPDVLAAAATGVRHLGADDVRGTLLPMLDHRDSGVRTAAADTLGALRDAAAVPALIAAVGRLDFPAEPDSAEYDPAADPEYLPVEPDEHDERLTLRPANAGVGALVMIGAPAAPAILDVLERGPPSPVAERLLYALADIPAAAGDPRVVALAAAAIDGRNRHQVAAAHALAALRPAGWLPPLARGFERERRRQSGQAADYAVALGASRDDAAAGMLVAALADPDDMHREIVVESLGVNRSAAARAWLDRARADGDLAAVAAAHAYFLDDRRPEVTDALIAALDEWGDAQMARALLNSGDARLHDAARAWAEDNGYIVIRSY